MPGKRAGEYGGKSVSVLINMEMPISCGDCPFENHTDDGYECGINGCLTEYQKRPDDCPLVPVPDYGRLIDADALIIDLMDRGIEGVQTDDLHEIQQAVMDAPVIIPAEEGE